MRAIAAGVTDVGRERDHNEDRFVLLPEFAVYVVADGMGGHQCGEVASRMATSTIASYFRKQREQRHNGALIDVLRMSLLEANERIHTRATSSSLHRGMGTTVVAAAFHPRDRMLYVAHAGDSRCYCMRAGRLHQLTRDHSLVEEALRTRPDITASELAYLPANVITRALGVESAVDVELTSAGMELGDLYLLCSDGLHGFVSDERIAEILRSGVNLTSLCADLVAEANRNGGGDNITAVVVRIEETDEPWSAPASGSRSGPFSQPPSVDVDAAADTDPEPTDPDATVRIAPPVGIPSEVLPAPPAADTAPAALAAEPRDTLPAGVAPPVDVPLAPEASKGASKAAAADGDAAAGEDKPKRRRRRRKRRKRDDTASAEAGGVRDKQARRELETDDTAQVEPVTDPDAVLKGRS